MKVKLLCKVVGPILRWGVKEVFQNPLIREYGLARVQGLDSKTALKHAMFRTGSTSRCPTCGSTEHVTSTRPVPV